MLLSAMLVPVVTLHLSQQHPLLVLQVHYCVVYYPLNYITQLWRSSFHGCFSEEFGSNEYFICAPHEIHLKIGKPLLERGTTLSCAYRVVQILKLVITNHNSFCIDLKSGIANNQDHHPLQVPIRRFVQKDGRNCAR